MPPDKSNNSKYSVAPFDFVLKIQFLHFAFRDIIIVSHLVFLYNKYNTIYKRTCDSVLVYIIINYYEM